MRERGEEGEGKGRGRGGGGKRERGVGRERGKERGYTSHKQLCLIRYVLHHLSTAVEELGISLCTD